MGDKRIPPSPHKKKQTKTKTKNKTKQNKTQQKHKNDHSIIKIVISGLFTWCCYHCAVCMLGARTGECVCTPAFEPASDITLRTRIRTLGGIQVGLFIVSIT